jgi:hypothetical protein
MSAAIIIEPSESSAARLGGFSVPAAATTLLALFLAHLGSKTYESIKRKLKLRAIESLASPYLLEYMVRHDADPTVRAAAAARLSNPRVIRQLLDNERQAVVRSVLIGRLPPAELLNLYARARGNRLARQEILQHVLDQKTLFECLRHEDDPKLVTTEMTRVTDPIYVDLLRQHSLAAVREWATRILPERLRLRGDMEANPDKILDALLSFATLTPQMQRLLAWVTVPHVFYELILRHPNSEVKQVALRSLAASRPRLLCKLAADERVLFDLRVTALSLCRTQDLDAVAKLAEADHDPRMRAQALSLLSGSPNLEDLVERRAQAETDAVVLLQLVQLTRRRGVLLKLQQRLTTLPAAAPLKDLVATRLHALKENDHV